MEYRCGDYYCSRACLPVKSTRIGLPSCIAQRQELTPYGASTAFFCTEHQWYSQFVYEDNVCGMVPHHVIAYRTGLGSCNDGVYKQCTAGPTSGAPATPVNAVATVHFYDATCGQQEYGIQRAEMWAAGYCFQPAVNPSKVGTIYGGDMTNNGPMVWSQSWLGHLNCTESSLYYSSQTAFHCAEADLNQHVFSSGAVVYGFSLPLDGYANVSRYVPPTPMPPWIKPSSSSSTWKIAVGVSVGVLALALAAGALWCYRKRAQAAQAHEQDVYRLA